MSQLFTSVAKVLEFQLQPQSFQWIFGLTSFKIDWFDLFAVQGTLKSLFQHQKYQKHQSASLIIITTKSKCENPSSNKKANSFLGVILLSLIYEIRTRSNWTHSTSLGGWANDIISVTMLGFSPGKWIEQDNAICWGDVKVTQSCPTLCVPIYYILHGVFQARILEWVAFPFFKGSSQLRDQTQVSRIAGGFFTIWATSPADLPDPGVEPGSPALQADSLPAELPGKMWGLELWIQMCCRGWRRRQEDESFMWAKGAMWCSWNPWHGREKDFHFHLP